MKPAAVLVVNYTNTSSGIQIQGEGSGVMFNKKGYIVTNNHVVQGAAKLGIMLPNGHKAAAKLIGKDSYSVLAVLQIPSTEVTSVAVFGDSDKLQVGEIAIAIGNPLGQAFDQSVTKGSH